MKLDIDEYTRRLRLKEFYYDDDAERISLASNNSAFCPFKGRDAKLDKYIDYVEGIATEAENKKNSLES